MSFSKKDVELFNEMFEVVNEYTTYRSTKLTENGLEENLESYDNSLNTTRATIRLSNGNEYIIDFGESHDAEGHAMDAFIVFRSLDYDEEKFEKYLEEEESSFRRT